MTKPTTPLALTFTAVAARPTTPPALLRRLCETVGPTSPDGLRAALAANPNLPYEDAVAVSGLADRAPDPAAVAALCGRADITDRDLCIAARVLDDPETGSGQHLLGLATAPGTSARVLRALEPVLRTSRHGRWHHTSLVAHPNADPDLVVGVLRQIVKRAGTTNPAAVSGMSGSLWLSTLKQIASTHAAAAFDTIDHAALLVDFTETHPALLDEARLSRLADVAVVDHAAWPYRRSSGAGKTHPLTRAVRVLAERGPEPVRRRCADALAAGGVKVVGQDPAAALGVSTGGERATASVGARTFRGVARSLSANVGVTDALATELAALDGDQWSVFCRLADDFPGSVDALLDTCRGIAATVS